MIMTNLDRIERARQIINAHYEGDADVRGSCVDCIADMMHLLAFTVGEGVIRLQIDDAVGRTRMHFEDEFRVKPEVPFTRYHTLLVRDRENDMQWSQEFGDADRDVVVAEQEDYIEHDRRRQDLQIVESDGTQADIERIVSAINAPRDRFEQALDVVNAMTETVPEIRSTDQYIDDAISGKDLVRAGVDPDDFEKFATGYLESMVSCESDADGQYLYTCTLDFLSDFELEHELGRRARQDCIAWLEGVQPWFRTDLSQAGFNFWKIRNGLGDFLPGDCAEDQSDNMSHLARDVFGPLVIIIDAPNAQHRLPRLRMEAGQ